jgi:16S rRNA (guanine527-N7)-methyltransferase
MDDPDLLLQGAAQLGLTLDGAAFDRFALLLELLQRTGQQTNLTSVRDAEGIVRRHFLESLALGALLRGEGLLSRGTRLLDIGSGAGFPGLPIKILEPECELYLLEATAKKADFLRLAIERLGLPTSHVLAGRAEALAHEAALRDSMDLATARAVARLPALVELGLPFLRVGGTLAAMKGTRLTDELNSASHALAACGGETIGVRELPGSEVIRAVLIRKTKPTPERYPRRPGQPMRHPIGDSH